MFKFWFLSTMFLINQVQNEKCCDAIERSNEGNVLKFVNTEKVSAKVNSEEFMPNIAKISVKEKPTQSLLNQNTVNLPTNKPEISNKVQTPISIKLTKSGSQFLKHLKNSINIHPILGKNSKIIKELLNEAILNATNALKMSPEKRAKSTENVEKASTGTVTGITKPIEVDYTSSTIHPTDVKHIEIKDHDNTPTSHKVDEITLKYNDQKMIISHDNSKRMKFNTTETVKHDDENPYERSTNDITSATHQNLFSTKVGVNEHNPANKTLKISFKNDSEAKFDKKEQDTSPTGIQKVDAISANNINQINPTQMQEKLITLLKPNSKAVLPQPTVENEMELPLFEDEIGCEKKSPSTMDVEDNVYEEISFKTPKNQYYEWKYSTPNNPTLQGWYNINDNRAQQNTNNPYFETYSYYQNAHPCYISTNNAYKPNTNYYNRGTYTMKLEDEKLNAPIYEQNYYSCKSYLNKQREYNDLLRKRWWHRKVHSTTGWNQGGINSIATSSRSNPYYYYNLIRRNGFQY